MLDYDKVMKMPSKRRIKFLTKRLKKQDKRMYELRDFEPDELIQFLRKNRIRSRKELRKIRKPMDPTGYDYVKAFGSWKEAQIKAHGKPIELPTMDANYIINTVYLFNAWTQEDYRIALRAKPDIVPSEYKVEKEFGTFGGLFLTASLRDFKGIVDAYFALYDRLRRWPTIDECESKNINIRLAMRIFHGNKREMDEHFGEYEPILRNLEGADEIQAGN